MTTITAGPAGLDMSALDLSVVVAGATTAKAAGSFTVDLGEGDIITVTGSNFTYDGANHLAGGTVTGLADDYLGQNAFQVSGFSEPAATLVGWATNNQSALGLQTLFSGDDTLTAPNATANVLYGYGGNDSIVGGAAADTLDGGAGANTIYGGAGGDSISSASSNGANFLRGEDGNDVMSCGTGYNNVNGNKGDDTITGKSLVGDWLLGGQGNDQISALQSTGHNIINGNMGADTLHGGTGGDTLRGGQGDDLIVGGAGNDWLSGDLGANTLTTGGGSDTIHAGAGVDTVTDFDVAHDVVLLDRGVSGIAGQVGADVHLNLSNGGQVILSNIQLNTLNSGWIISS